MMVVGNAAGSRNNWHRAVASWVFPGLTPRWVFF